MKKHKISNMTNFAKLVCCVVLLLTLGTVALQDILPQMSYARMFLYIFVALCAFAAVLVGLSLIYLTIYQWVLRKGGTDPAWFWFSSEPKGLVALRLSKARENKQ
jgi:hypothetical protein